MVETAVADVVGPAVAADNPDALAHQVLRERPQAMRCRIVKSCELVLERCDATSLRVDVRLADLRRVEQFPNARRRRAAARAREQALAPARAACRATAGNPSPNSALSSNSEFAQAGPRPCLVDRPRRRRQVAAVDGGTPGRVRDQQTVAEELREQSQVRRLAAAGAGAGDTRTAASGTDARAPARASSPAGCCRAARRRTRSSCVRARGSAPSRPC